MKHWRIEDVAWDRFDPTKVDPQTVTLVKAAAMVERNGTDYARYLHGVFGDDPDFRQAADNWAVEEVQHGDALGRWATLADPAWDYAAAFDRYRSGYQIDVAAGASIRGSRSGELIARCIVETGTSSYYSALADATGEPVLQQICRLIASDEFRHFKLFYDHLRRYLTREQIGLLRRLRIAAGRVGETEDDELAFAFHCSNDPEGAPYRARSLPRGLPVRGDGALPVPPSRTRHGHDLQGGWPAATRPAIRRGDPGRLADDAVAPAPVRGAAAARERRGLADRPRGDPGSGLSILTRFYVRAGLL